MWVFFLERVVDFEFTGKVLLIFLRKCEAMVFLCCFSFTL